MKMITPEKRLVAQIEEDALVDMIIDYANRHKFTIANINEAVEKVLKYMENNAVLEFEDCICAKIQPTNDTN